MSFSTVSILPETDASQQLIVTWQNPEIRAVYPVGVLAKEHDYYSFAYLKRVSKATGFRPFAGFEDMSRLYQSDTLFDFFESRVLSAKRPDFRSYVEKLDLEVHQATPWELLVKSSGRTKGDTVQLFPVPRESEGKLRLPILISGTRYLMEKSVGFLGKTDGNYPPQVLEDILAGLEPGQKLDIVRETANPSSTVARLALEAAGRPIGYLPEWIAEETDSLIEQGLVELLVKRVNPPEVGWHMRLLAELVISAPGRSLFAKEDWALADR